MIAGKIGMLIFLLANEGRTILEGDVVGVADGDTITVLDKDFKQHKIRLSDIDAPEKAQPFGTRAKQELGDLVFGEKVHVEIKGLDRYGREIGTVFLVADPEASINLHMVRKGFAWQYSQYSKDPEFHFAEIEARAEKIGLWVDPQPVPPWMWRHPAADSSGKTTSKAKKAKKPKSKKK